ncbi:unnamed protein product [Nippostrongylus brasiliensis]|uniref:SSD domain-containing protein n=1 Tax=Nippostrongylus brasiliensis TaxID=27835 RepID=A0A0N4YR29_NIPBR|nr:unnamed protein product [Nippostrongylus brasiliensis]
MFKDVLVEAKDGGSLLRSGYREQVWDLVEEISTKIKVKDSSGRELTYMEMCEPYCGKNDAFITLLKLYNQNYSRIDITYPTMDILGKQVFIAGNIYGVHLANGSNSVEGFDTVILRYYMVYPETKPLYDWEAKMVHLLYDSGKYDLLKSGAASDSLVAQEVKEMGEKSAPLLSIALAVLMAFLMICSFRSKRRESKPLEALLGGATPLLAGVTTVGVVSATGLAFQSIVVSTLFLLLAIGIDDVFIMLAAWHRTERELDIPQRVAQMVKVSGCSMTVTSITNIISFGNGVFSSTPVLQTFAIYSVVASMICYLYQLILFPAILTLTAHKEYEKSDEDKSCLPEELKCIKKAGEFHDRAWKTLARLVGKPWLRVLMIAVLLVYWTFTYYGISTVETDLSVQKLAPKEARIVIFKERYDEVIKGMQTVAIVVTTPGDLRDPKVFADVNNTIRDYETASYSYGPESTFCFLKPYMEFLEFHEGGEEDEEIPFTYKHIPAFIKSDGYWKATMRINETACALDEPECLTSFLFTTGFTTLASYNEMFPLIEEWRAIARKHPALGVYAYSERSTYADQV